MEIRVSDKNLRAALRDDAGCVRRYGTEMARKLRLRLAALRAADSLEAFWPPISGPERCHELKGERAGSFSIDLRHPYRLLSMPRPSTTTPQPERLDEHQRWATINAIDILGIEDTHG
jgi:plasmid maintenance system killer protein